MNLGDILFFPFFAGFTLVALLVGALVLAFWIWMIIDSARRKYKNDVEKVIWLIVIILGTWLGALAYFLIIRISNPSGLMKGNGLQAAKKGRVKKRFR